MRQGGRVSTWVVASDGLQAPDNPVPRRHKPTRVVPEPACCIHMRILRLDFLERTGNMKEEGGDPLRIDSSRVTKLVGSEVLKPPSPLALPVKLPGILFPQRPEIGLGNLLPSANYLQNLLRHASPQGVDGVGMTEPMGCMSSMLARFANRFRIWQIPLGNRDPPVRTPTTLLREA